MDEDEGVRMVCLTCCGDGHIHEPKLAVLGVLGGQAQTVLAPRTCPQCGHLDEPGWLPGFIPPV